MLANCCEHVLQVAKARLALLLLRSLFLLLDEFLLVFVELSVGVAADLVGALSQVTTAHLDIIRTLLSLTPRNIKLTCWALVRVVSYLGLRLS